MTYSQNQFYKIGVYEKDVNVTNPDFRQPTDNPRFLWPSDVNHNTVAGQSPVINRGYMRLISTAFGTDAPASLGKRRLHFQFNPDTLSRNVAARNDVQLWMNQDPIQFTQPIPSDANFNFELIFNREQEVASGKYRTNSSVVDGNNSFSAINEDGTVNSVYDPSSVTQIGVLADLLVFDQLIGQGINAQLITALSNKAKKDLAAYNAQKKADAKSSGLLDPEDTDPVIPGQVETNESNISNTLNLGVGNSAFIVSQPIRIVFSSLYMVEGFITSTNVTFDKFNPAMVPVQCRIAVSMQAMYIGFAAKRTFLSTIYEDVRDNEYAEGNGSPEAIVEKPELEALGKNLWKEITTTGNNSDSISDYYFDAYAKIFQVPRIGSDEPLEFKVGLKPKEEFNKWISLYKNDATVTATCEWLVKYHGRATEYGGTTIDEYQPTGTDYDGSKAEIVFARRAEYTVNLTDVSDGRDSMEFIFDRPRYAPTGAGVNAEPNIGRWDTDGKAIWESIINVVFTINGTNATNIRADQMIKGSFKSSTGVSVDKEKWHVSKGLKLQTTGGKVFNFNDKSGQVG